MCLSCVPLGSVMTCSFAWCLYGGIDFALADSDGGIVSSAPGEDEINPKP
jgi:hypothetical protein